MAQSFFPAAYGFAVSVGKGAPQPSADAFATRGRQTRVNEKLRDRSVDAVLVHPGADASRAHASDGAVLLVLAGEIYNRDEIQATVGAAADASDAELLLGLVEKYGIHAFRLVNGRYAAVLAEPARVLVATDHAGSVPVFARLDRGQVLIATEAKAFAASSAGAPHPHVAGARPVRGLTGCHQVAAGTVLEIGLDSGAVTAHTTWTPPMHRRLLDEGEAVDLVRCALEKAVFRRLPAGGRPLVVLSGGIDSSSVAALAGEAVPAGIDTLSMGTDASDEFPQARTVAEHLGSAHREITIPVEDLLARLPHTVHAAESTDPEVIEYLLPLTALYERMEGPPRRVLTGYGADIPLGGMHREDRLPRLDSMVVHDMGTFDGLNEMSPVLSTAAGHWSTHPYWDREVLEALTSLESGLKRRYGQDKWVLRASMGDLLPTETVLRPKLGVHEGSGTTSSFTALLRHAGVEEAEVAGAKARVVQELFARTVAGGVPPEQIAIEEVVKSVATGRGA